MSTFRGRDTLSAGEEGEGQLSCAVEFLISSESLDSHLLSRGGGEAVKGKKKSQRTGVFEKAA